MYHITGGGCFCVLISNNICLNVSFCKGRQPNLRGLAFAEERVWYFHAAPMLGAHYGCRAPSEVWLRATAVIVMDKMLHQVEIDEAAYFNHIRTDAFQLVDNFIHSQTDGVCLSVTRVTLQAARQCVLLQSSPQRPRCTRFGRRRTKETHLKGRGGLF